MRPNLKKPEKKEKPLDVATIEAPDDLLVRLRQTIKTGCLVGLSFYQLAPHLAQQAGQPEGSINLRISLGSVSAVAVEVRQHHGRSYSRAQKTKMLEALAALQRVVTEVITEQRSAVEAFETAPDEEEGL